MMPHPLSLGASLFAGRKFRCARPSARRSLATAVGVGLLGLAVPAAATEGVVFDAGATTRVRGETYDARPFGPTGSGDEDYILWRGFVDTELRAVDQAWAVHLQLGLFRQSGRDRGATPTDEDHLDVRQAYLETGLWPAARLRVGRQELAFGSSRLVSVRDGPNIRRTFQGLLLTEQRSRWRTQAFLVQPVEDRSGVLDDRGDDGQLFGGVYVTYAAKGSGVELYWLALERDSARFGAVVARERRQSAGARVFGRSGAVDYNVEGVGQWGSFGGRQIRAWTVASDSGVTLAEHPLRPRLGLKANITSGDRHPADRRLGTFNPLFPNLSYFNEAALLAPQNHIDLHPSLTVDFTPTLQASVGADWFWKAARADDVYRGPGQPIGARGGSKRVGRQINMNLRWRPVTTVEVKASYVRFDVGPALQAVGGRNTDYGMISVQTHF